MDIQTLMESLSAVVGAILLLGVLVFLLYGTVKGWLLERDYRLRSRRKYS